eukprot:scaffold1970_cov396-Prasinococcus_capsulatus_cf.AAC.28
MLSVGPCALRRSSTNPPTNPIQRCRPCMPRQSALPSPSAAATSAALAVAIDGRGAGAPGGSLARTRLGRRRRIQVAGRWRPVLRVEAVLTARTTAGGRCRCLSLTAGVGPPACGWSGGEP